MDMSELPLLNKLSEEEEEAEAVLLHLQQVVSLELSLEY